MSTPAQTEIANNTLGKRSSKNGNFNSIRASLKWRRLEMAKKRASSRRASSESCSFEEITADLNRIEAEVAERGSSENTSADLQRLERSKAYLRKRMHSEAEHIKKMTEAMDEIAEEIAGKRGVMNRGLILFWPACPWFLLLSVIFLSVIGFKIYIS
ncbi:uncharacterized protein LOC119988477 [Tripterygium wilfordii]|uniref:uncharacterized protein LOC119988477 n=1 Tax=Tripterygium wilfordii TaxID=458696 RepID=UPI0018F7F948|nr:uncharacterized protein LOC119988477 [Tripterygium wilfordii]XP_038689455.1 uncharacterized protein LOC119988477 [Tripterygium wilfordii]XP_038689456.1 uncharacterized protein LOC119988477 [Tripterygium wilfordii]XP_038689458.1 uncharacterized protein LOC119988477 [Tripterygium wilfordii]